jgi:hypothetical protein
MNESSGRDMHCVDGGTAVSFADKNPSEKEPAVNASPVQPMGSFVVGWSKGMSSAGFVKLRRGVTDHLSAMSGTEWKVFCALLLAADHNTGSTSISLTDLGRMVGCARSSIQVAVRSLVDGEYITYKPAKNQWDASVFAIPKYNPCRTGAVPVAVPSAVPEIGATPEQHDSVTCGDAPLKNSISKKQEEVHTERTDLVKVLARFSGWNGDKSADKQEAALHSDFPRLDLLDCAKSWAAWAEDCKKPPTICWSSFRNWCKRDHDKLPPAPKREVW